MATTEATRILKDLDAALNSGDVDGAASLFRDDAEVRLLPSPGAAYRGVEEIRLWLKWFLVDSFHVTSTRLKSTGNDVTWHFAIDSKRLRQLGVSPLKGAGVAVIEGGKIKTFVARMDSVSVRKLEQAVDPHP
jgi:hypothetical protein